MFLEEQVYAVRRYSGHNRPTTLCNKGPKHWFGFYVFDVLHPSGRDLAALSAIRDFWRIPSLFGLVTFERAETTN
jgi:hypothetical protein